MARRSSYRLHDSTGHWLARVFMAMRREFDEALKSHDVTIVEWAVLAGLLDEAADTPSGLAAYSSTDRAVISRALARLEKKRLVSRRSNAEDGRSFALRATAKGTRIAEALMAANQDINQRYLAGLSRDDIDGFRKVLRHMLGNSDATVLHHRETATQSRVAKKPRRGRADS